MPKFTVEEAQKLLVDREYVRNLGVIAHIDHGKSTLTDSLLAACGLLAEKVAGVARATDTREDEQERGITIKTTGISLVHDLHEKTFLINLQDTPGHVDFSGEVTSALRVVDGALVVVDAVEGVMVQTEVVTQQALAERVRPVLIINKVDRLITEMRMSPENAYDQFKKIIKATAKKYDLDPSLINSVILAESNGNPKAVSPAGAKGLMQLIDSTAIDMGVTDSFDPKQNIEGGSKYLRRMLDRFGDLKQALAAYNAGPETVKKYGGIPPYPETIEYLDRVLENHKTTKP